jgi:hypothetical protein
MLWAPLPLPAVAPNDVLRLASASTASIARPFLLTVLRALNVIQPCPVCGCEPGPTPSFCQFARDADAKAATERCGPHRLLAAYE